MRKIEAHLSRYKSVHLNKKNVISHFIGVPLILWAIALVFSTLTFTVEIAEKIQTHSVLPFLALALFIYYLLLNSRLAFLAIILLSPIFYHASLYNDHIYVYWLAVIVFIIGWLCQFLGHYFEQAKPAFFDDIKQLLIGPLFLIAELYFACGFEKELANKIHQTAIAYRKKMAK